MVGSVNVTFVVVKLVVTNIVALTCTACSFNTSVNTPVFRESVIAEVTEL